MTAIEPNTILQDTKWLSNLLDSHKIIEHSEQYLFDANEYGNLRYIKQRITKSAKEIIDQCDRFKFGKSCNSNERESEHEAYSKIFLLCASKSKKLISELEAHYIEKHFDFENNDNKKKDSTDRISHDAEIYFLYIVTS